MKRLFISQPMRGKAEHEILKERDAAIKAAREAVGEELVLLNSYFGDFNGNALEYLGKSIMVLYLFL